MKEIFVLMLGNFQGCRRFDTRHEAQTTADEINHIAGLSSAWQWKVKAILVPA
jgi:hypothetical protein